MKRVTVLFLLVCALLLVPTASALAAAPTPTFNQAIDQLVAQGYPQQIETYLDSLGTSPLGFRLAGSSADNAAADYLLRQFKAMGLANVRLEPVPVDVWDVRGASVTVGGRTMTGSQFAGVPGTPTNGLTGEVVYVKNGLAQDYAGLDVTGKIVLVDTTLDNWWMNMPGAEATLHGAKAMIMTYGPGSFSWTTSYPWYVPGDSLGGNDGEYDMRWVPIVYISRNDGEWLRSQLTAGSQTATVKSDVRVTMADDGGVGYNVVAEIPGSVKNGQKVLVLAHHDAHFRPGMDDTGAVAAQMTIAKAMKMSGYKPQRTIVFMSTTGEEFGYTNCWYDWCIGAWYSNTVTHPTWPGTVAGLINLELMARNGCVSGHRHLARSRPVAQGASDEGGQHPAAERLRREHADQHLGGRLDVHRRRRPQRGIRSWRSRLRRDLPHQLRDPGPRRFHLPGTDSQVRLRGGKGIRQRASALQPEGRRRRPGSGRQSRRSLPGPAPIRRP